MVRSKVYEVKRGRKKALFFREITSLIQELGREEKTISDVYVTHIDISADTGICYVFFASYKEPGEEVFEKALEVLKLYRPSLRRAFAARVKTRYAPELIFRYNKAKEKERKVNLLLNKVQDELSEENKDEG